MHDRARNFCSFLADVFDKYLPHTKAIVEPNTEGEDSEVIPSDLEVVSNTIRHYFDAGATFKNWQFGALGLICNHENGRGRMESIRELGKKENEEEARKVIANIRQHTSTAKEFIQRLETTSDDDLLEIVRKFALYIHLFTAMYFNKQ